MLSPTAGQYAALAIASPHPHGVKDFVGTSLFSLEEFSVTGWGSLSVAGPSPLLQQEPDGRPILDSMSAGLAEIPAVIASG